MKVATPKKPTVKAPKPTMPSSEIIEAEDTSVDNLLEVIGELSEVLVARTVVIKGLVLALLTRQHVLLHGPGGLAKTMAAQELFHRVEGDDHRVFKLQLSKGSQVEHLFGPLNLKRFKEDSVYEYNTKGMLPEAHFAILDEVYRSPDSLLSTLMSVLNERIVFSSGQEVKCPLITCVGTTNFVSENAELLAFHDRWLVNVKVSPLSAPDDRMKMFSRALAGHAPRKAGVQFHNLAALQDRVQKVKFDEILLNLYIDLISGLKSGGVTFQNEISDRRTVQTLNLIRAAAVLSDRDHVTLDDIEAARYGLTCVGNRDEDTHFDNVFGRIASNFAAMQQEMQQLDQIRVLEKKLADAYTEGLPLARLERQRDFARQTIEQIDNMTFTQPATSAARDKVRKSVEQLLTSISEDIMQLNAKDID